MYKTNKTDDLTVIYGVCCVCCVRTERLGSPNSALLPYKMGGTLQRLLAVRGMGRDPQRREPEAIEYSLLAKAPFYPVMPDTHRAASKRSVSQ
jgi:hypothetical protein